MKKGEGCFRCDGTGYVHMDFGRTRIPCPLCCDVAWWPTVLIIALMALLMILSLYSMSLEPM